MFEIIEMPGRLEIHSPMRTGTRILFALIALIPLAAPYELLLRTSWRSILHPFFAIALFISLGAMALSAFLVFTALSGLDSRMAFSLQDDSFTYSASAPVVRLVTSTYALSAMRSIEIGSREWSDGGPTYHIEIEMSGGEVFESASSWSRAEVELAHHRIIEFLGEATSCHLRTEPRQAPS